MIHNHIRHVHHHDLHDNLHPHNYPQVHNHHCIVMLLSSLSSWAASFLIIMPVVTTGGLEEITPPGDKTRLGSLSFVWIQLTKHASQ